MGCCCSSSQPRPPPRRGRAITLGLPPPPPGLVAAADALDFRPARGALPLAAALTLQARLDGHGTAARVAGRDLPLPLGVDPLLGTPWAAAAAGHDPASGVPRGVFLTGTVSPGRRDPNW